MLHPELRDDGIYVFDDEDSSKPSERLCERASIIERQVNIISGQEDVTIELLAPTGRKTPTFSRSCLKSGILRDLLPYGLHLLDYPDNDELLLRALLNYEDEATISYTHDVLGFNNINSQEVYLAHKPIGLNKNDPYTASVYTNPEITAPSGDFDGWKKAMQEEVIGHPNLELALALGASAPIAHLLRQEKVLVNVPIFALIGPSSTGKTLALRVGASIFGSCEEGGLVGDINATRSAFFSKLAGMVGFPLIMDETTSRPNWDLASDIYDLAKGQDKWRNTPKGKPIPPKKFSGTILFSGERSLFAQSKDMPGMHARMIEFTLPWTDSAEHAERLERGCRNNCGTAVRKLLPWLMSHRRLLVLYFEMFFQDLKVTIAKTSNQAISGVDERRIKLMALLLLTAWVIDLVLKLPMDVIQMKKLLLDIFEEQRAEADPVLEAYEGLIQMVMSHGAKFPTENSTRPELVFDRDILGVRGKNHGWPCVWIGSKTFQQYVKEVTNLDRLYLCQELHKRHLIEKKNGKRFSNIHKIQDMHPSCYCVYTMGPCPTPTTKQKKRTQKRSSQLKSLLSDDDD